MKLTPPPRLGDTRPAESREEASLARQRLLATLGTVFAFAFLFACAIAAFLFLPRWVQERGKAQVATELEPGVEVRGEVSPSSAESNGQLEQPESAPPESPTAAAGARAPQPHHRRKPKGPSAPPPATPSRETSGAPNGDAAFASEMSAGLEALEADQYASARDAFQRALAADPGSASAADGLRRAEEALKIAAVLELREQAAAAEDREEWKLAIRHYEQALKHAPGVEFALAGISRATERAALDQRLAAYLERPGRLSSPNVHAEAKVFLTMANEMDSAGPKLTAQRRRLEELLTAYSSPVRATLVSDERTEVVVYGVGRLGAFARRDVELLPGTYTIVGSRPGYRDVRRELIVEPGKEPKALTVRCEEEI